MPRRVRMLIVASALVLTLVCSLFSFVKLWREDMALTRKLLEQERVYHALQDKYLAIRADTNRLKNDKDYQGETLKGEFGYVESNEVPIVVVDPDEKPKAKGK